MILLYKIPPTVLVSSILTIIKVKFKGMTSRLCVGTHHDDPTLTRNE